MVLYLRHKHCSEEAVQKRVIFAHPWRVNYISVVKKGKASFKKSITILNNWHKWEATFTTEESRKKNNMFLFLFVWGRNVNYHASVPFSCSNRYLHVCNLVVINSWKSRDLSQWKESEGRKMWWMRNPSCELDSFRILSLQRLAIDSTKKKRAPNVILNRLLFCWPLSPIPSMIVPLTHVFRPKKGFTHSYIFTSIVSIHKRLSTVISVLCYSSVFLLLQGEGTRKREIISLPITEY